MINLMRMESQVTKLSFKKAQFGIANPNLAIAGTSKASGFPQPVRLSDTQKREESQETRTAEKIVASCLENVRFLNQHLIAYEEWLVLPAEVDNALYLAYTIEVRDNAPFSADDLRLWLSHLDIETQPAFSFVAPEYIPAAVKHRFADPQKTKTRENVFCLPCHHYVSIPGLMHILEGFETFFAQVRPALSTADQQPPK
jgi:hypothetical protein